MQEWQCVQCSACVCEWHGRDVVARGTLMHYDTPHCLLQLAKGQVELVLESRHAVVEGLRDKKERTLGEPQQQTAITRHGKERSGAVEEYTRAEPLVIPVMGRGLQRPSLAKRQPCHPRPTSP